VTLKVAFVLAALGAGGAEGIVAQLSEAAVREGWEATIVTFDSPGDPVFHPIDPRVTLERLGSRAGGGSALRIIRRIVGLRRCLRSRKFDVTISFLTRINTITLLAGMGVGGRIIVSERNNAALQGTHWLWNRLLGVLYPFADAIVMQTERSRERLGRRARRTSVVIPNPVRCATVMPDSQAPPTLVAVGRLTHQKGFDLLIAAFARVADRHPDWRLIIWGEGPDRLVLERQIRSLGLADRITLPGLSDVPGGWLRSATLFVLPSRYEGWPNVLAEAMAAGLPVVAFDCDYGPADIIKNKTNGIIVETGNCEALAEALSELIVRKDLRTKIGGLGQQSMSRFEASAVLRRWLHLIRICATERDITRWKTDPSGEDLERHCP
jgi:glycosyltransferase involved in cell wall biosynthesis